MFILSDDLGDDVYQLDTPKTSLRLPETLKLEQVTIYDWRVIPVRNKRQERSRKSYFFTATAEDLNRLEKVAYLKEGSLSDRILYAIDLQSLALEQEMGQVLMSLEKERPGIFDDLGQ